MAKSVLVGFRSFTSKKGTPCNMAYVVTEFTPAEIARGAIGSNCQSVFLSDETAAKITPQCIGKEVELIYSISGGRAYLEDINLVGK